MGGHGGLNILPQKRWNVYNFDNREKVRKDEEEAAREEQLKREQSHRRDAEFRVEKLRQARGLAAAPRPSVKKPSDSNHINLFQGLEDFSSLSGASEAAEEKRNPKKDDVSKRDPKRKREERPVVVSPEDEKYRMGYGVAGKGVKAPWYLSRPSLSQLVDGTKEVGPSGRDGVVEKKKKMGEGKKTIEQLREERMERERQEKNRERALLVSSARQKRRGL